MEEMTKSSDEALLLKGAHVIDPEQGIDRVADVLIEGGRIKAVGEIAPNGAARTIDLSGSYLTPGWVDAHVHAYGTLGFADPDSIGIYQGVTTYVEAGGPGIGTLDEYIALMSKRTRTSLYVGPYIRPMGIIGLSYLEGDPRSLGEVPIDRWMDFADAHRDEFRYLKIGAFESYGTGPLKIGKGLAEILKVPLYVHFGEHQMQGSNQPKISEIFDLTGPGDIITHLYHGNGGKVLDPRGKVFPEVFRAQERGVLYDIGFGGYNFSWDVAEKAFAQGLAPDMISSDLQQLNVIGPCYSLAHVMGIFLRLGMTLNEVIACVTSKPARALSLDDRAGSLRPGMPADITVFRVETGDYVLSDTSNRTRTADKAVVPWTVFKDGEQLECDLVRCQDDKNWLLQFALDHVPEAAAGLAKGQRAFLGRLAEVLSGVDWKLGSAENLDLRKATELQAAFHVARKGQDCSLRDALNAVFAAFLDSPFTMQIGLFLLRIERPLALERLKAVAAGAKQTAGVV